jgi:hypothetical protein
MRTLTKSSINFDEISPGLPLFNWAIEQQMKIIFELNQDHCYCTTAALKQGVVCWKCQRDFEHDQEGAE